MHIIQHRINTASALKTLDPCYGAEIDLRSNGQDIILHHDPYKDGPRFEDWLKNYCHGTLILNVKEEGLESRILDILAARKISDFFFLDQSFPFLLKTAKSGERRCAVRWSEYETFETVEAAAPLIDWVWIDCFTRFPILAEHVEKLKKLGLKTCLVSPELQGRWAPEEVIQARNTFKSIGFTPSAVCTKVPEQWS
jgi:hypothetical protein